MKRCNDCGLEKPFGDYHKWSRSADGYYNKCKSCRSVYDANHYKSNENRRRTISETNARIRKENRIKYQEYKAQQSCIDCGNPNPIVLEFDHLADKVGNVSAMIKNCSWEKVLEEISKCEVVCANCHRIRTHNRKMA